MIFGRRRFLSALFGLGFRVTVLPARFSADRILRLPIWHSWLWQLDFYRSSSSILGPRRGNESECLGMMNFVIQYC